MVKNLSRAQKAGTAFRCISGGCVTWVVMVGQFTTSMPHGNEKLVGLLLGRVIDQGEVPVGSGDRARRGAIRRHRDAASEDDDVVVTSRD